MERVYFSLEEANQLLPFLRQTLGELKDVKQQIKALVKKIQEDDIDFEGLFKKSELSDKEQGYRKKLEALGDRVNGYLYKIQEKGPIVKDIDQGLIDFFARIEDRDVFLCWKMGEPEVQFYHGLFDGFSGRRSLFKRSILEEVAKVH